MRDLVIRHFDHSCAFHKHLLSIYYLPGSSLKCMGDCYNKEALCVASMFADYYLGKEC